MKGEGLVSMGLLSSGDCSVGGRSKRLSLSNSSGLISPLCTLSSGLCMKGRACGQLGLLLFGYYNSSFPVVENLYTRLLAVWLV